MRSLTSSAKTGMDAPAIATAPHKSVYTGRRIHSARANKNWEISAASDSLIMNDTLYIQGGARLEGEVSVSGGKNAALAIIPAALLAQSPCTIENLPDIEDVRVLLEMVRCLGAHAEFHKGVMTIDPTTVDSYIAPYELAKRFRASYYLVPVLLGLFSHASVALPGGCDIGARPIDQTIKGMEMLGAQVRIEHGSIVVHTEGLHASEVYLDMPSVGATINTMLTAVSASGSTSIHNAAKEPHIVDVANFLNSMGARIRGAGTDIIRVNGGRPLHGSNYTIVPDQIETGTLMIAAAATGGDVVIHGAIPTHMEALSAKLLEMGVLVEDFDDKIHVRAGQRLRSVNVKTQAYPGFPTDLQQPLTSLLTIAKGSSIVTETIYESRFKFVEELQRMGAKIHVIDRTAIVEGVDKLYGAPVQATDLRAGASMIVAGLIAEGITEVSGTRFIMRGYENIDQKLRQLGAQIEARPMLCEVL